MTGTAQKAFDEWWERCHALPKTPMVGEVHRLIAKAAWEQAIFWFASGLSERAEQAMMFLTMKDEP